MLKTIDDAKVWVIFKISKFIESNLFIDEHGKGDCAFDVVSLAPGRFYKGR